MDRFGRREAIRLTLGGVPILAWGCDGSSDDATGPVGIPPEDAEDVASWLLTVPREGLAPGLRDRVGAGLWTGDSVFAGIVLLGARTVDSAFGGGGFHAVLQVEALRFLTRTGEEADLLPALVHGAVATLRAGATGFELPPVTLNSLPGPDEAETSLIRAVEEGLVETATRAAIALLRAGEVGRLHEALLELGPRRAHKLWHEAICTAKVLTVLRDLPGAWSEDVYRAIVWALMTRDVPSGPEQTELWQGSRDRVLVVPPDWVQGVESPGRISEVATTMRGVDDPAVALDVIEGFIEASLAPTSLWDGLVVSALESVYAGSNYHTFTAIQALREGFLLASSDRVRLLILLQAAVLLAVDHAAVGVGLPLSEIDSSSVSLDEVFAGDRTAGFLAAVGYLQGGGDADAFVRRLRTTALMRASDEHHFKIPNAALVEAERLPQAWRPFALAATRFFAPSDEDPEAEAWQLSQA